MNWLARTGTVATLTALSLVVAPLVCAGQGSTRSAEALYADATAKEAAVHKALADPDRQLTVLKAVRVVIADFEAVVRHYPSSSYSDDALWHGGKLSRDAFEAFHDPHERTTALRLLQLLASDYPKSKLARRVPEEVAWLKAHQTLASTPPVSPPARPAAAPAQADAAKLITVKDVRRTVLADTVRVVIELDSEVAFRDQRLESPDRIFVDLPTTQVLATLADRTLRFDNDNDLVRQLRVGRQGNNTTRVVIEAAGVSSYSIYPLYSPFRLVIDCLRTKPAAARPLATTGGSAPTQTMPTAAAARSVASPAVRPVAPKPLPLLFTNSIQAVLPLPGGVVLALPDVVTQTAAVETKPLPPLPSKPTPVPSAAAQASASAASAAGASGLSIARQLGLGVSRIVIDPGHGGHDPGAQASGITEADLTLDVALRVEKLLRKLPGVEVVLTRRDNSFIPLQERTAIANRENADLFLSIHANASSVPAARGIETYFLNFATNQGAAAVAARENAASGQSMGSLQDALKAIAFNSKLDESRDFAGNIQRELLEGVKPANKTVKDLGVKQAPFYVLIGAAMPSVLAEISFITNPQEAKLLDSSAYRQRIAQALFDGVRKYQLSLRVAPAIAQQQ
jgi:N-acetylmuramoyl-L-alanine amidase